MCQPGVCCVSNWALRMPAGAGKVNCGVGSRGSVDPRLRYHVFLSSLCGPGQRSTSRGLQVRRTGWLLGAASAMPHLRLRVFRADSSNCLSGARSSKPYTQFRQHEDEVNRTPRNPHEQSRELLVFGGRDTPDVANEMERTQFVDRMQVRLVMADRQKSDNNAKHRADGGGSEEIQHCRGQAAGAAF